MSFSERVLDHAIDWIREDLVRAGKGQATSGEPSAPWAEAIQGTSRRFRLAKWTSVNNMANGLSRALEGLAFTDRKVKSSTLDGMSAAWLEVLKLDDVVKRLKDTWRKALGTVQISDTEFEFSADGEMIRAVGTVPEIDQAVPVAVTPFSDDDNAKPLAPKARTLAARNGYYVLGLAEVALATLVVVFRLTPKERVHSVLVNLMVDSVDGATGRDRRYCVLSVQVTRQEFEELDLARVDPLLCIRSLKAVVPRGRGEILPVRPIINFDKADRRIVDANDIVPELNSRPNLMELTPTEFEGLIQNLFTAIGLDTHQTQASRDGGVDCIAYDSRPIFGGKIIIQAKRYKNVVGVSAVRDLYGTMMNEGASKGILVTTSHYGAATFEFAKNKPLELLEGAHLLQLLKEHTGVDAKIVVPEDWIDPAPE